MTNPPIKQNKIIIQLFNTNIEINNNCTVTNNTPFDQDRQDNNISQLMAKELRRFGKITRK